MGNLRSLAKAASFFVLVYLLKANAYAIEEISVMSFNVENFFDTEDDPLTRDEAFTPGGTYEWTAKKLKEKSRHLADVVTPIKNSDGTRCPHILGLVEVENKEVLQYWKQYFMQACDYRAPIIEDPQSGGEVGDFRGIKVALLSRFKLMSQPILHFAYRGGRYILEATFDVDGHPLTVFVNHWKSRIRDDGEELRMKAASVLMSRLQEFNAQDPYADYIVMGDMNDEPENKSIATTLKVTPNLQYLMENPSDVFLWDASFEKFHLPSILEEQRSQVSDEELKEIERYYLKIRGTYYYKKEKTFYAIDHMILPRGMFDTRGFSYVKDSFRVLRHKDYTDADGAPIPYKPYRGGAEGGASDHFPIFLRLSLSETGY